MGKRRVSSFLIVVVLCCALVTVVCGAYEEEGRREETGGGEGGAGWREGGGGGGGGEEGGAGKREGEDQFLLQDSKQVLRTDAGDVRVVRGFGGRFMKSLMHIGFITMEPKSLFIPQYLDSSLILFIRRGEARIGHIYKDELKLHIICSIDTSDSLGFHSFQSFYIGGGKYPASILSGFDPLTLATAFNVSIGEVGELLSRQQAGPIVYLNVSHSPSVWTKFLNLEDHHKFAQMKRIVHIGKDGEEEKAPRWSFSKFLTTSIFGSENKRREDKGPDSYNIYDRKPDFKNEYGWSIALDKSDYSPLEDSDFGIYLVNLSAGSMMAPHVNPRATEYGVVLRGAGTIQIVYPNGRLAMNAKVSEGDVFFIPRYFPFCQIASRTGPFEFFGFTTSARNNKPQFLVGANSLLQALRGQELATAFGLSEERLKEILDAQSGSTILPSATVSPPDVTMQVEVGKAKKVAKMIRIFD
ncbi:RmlC-like cupins superfamily protein [Abeliophyllum distichum]|uniref:RmlC-like cupins superfamily protein n=1 Tax=Abeliophyllum distichum TaxID=126358 RepID=A0ABD1Q4K4_9LAMI